jgi:hypothetical protein
MGSNPKRNVKTQRRGTNIRPLAGRSQVPDRRSSRSAVLSIADAKRSYERYVSLARAAGDAIESENFYQHAEHYFRMMREQSA